jgi:hypothetical protein
MSHRPLAILAEDDDDPMLSAVNLVDVFLVLVVALLTAVAAHSQQSASERVTIVRNAGQPDMEVVVRENGREVRYRGTGGSAEGSGVRAGVAYRMKDGNIVYMPEPEPAMPAAAKGAR